MFNFSRLFRSRWAALLWAAGICWSAISFVGDNAPPAPTGNAQDGTAEAASVQHLQNMVAQFERQGSH